MNSPTSKSLKSNSESSSQGAGGTKGLSLKVLDGQTEIVEEELQVFLDFFKKWSRELFWAAVIAFAAFYAFKSYQQGVLDSKKAAAAQFMLVRGSVGELREAVRGLSTAEEKGKADAQKKVDDVSQRLSEQIKALEHTKAPYTELAPVYRAIVANIKGDASAAKEILGKDSIGGMVAGFSDANANSMYKELTALNVARTLLNDPASETDAMTIIKALVEKGSFVGISAGKALVAVSKTPEEKVEAKKLLSGLIDRKPELRDALSDQLSRLDAAVN